MVGLPIQRGVETPEAGLLVGMGESTQSLLASDRQMLTNEHTNTHTHTHTHTHDDLDPPR